MATGAATAAFVDTTVVVLVFVVVEAALGLMLSRPLPRLAQLGPDYLVDVAINGDALAVAGLFLLSIFAFIYFSIFNGIRGQTPGQRLFRVRVIDAYGQCPSLGRSVARTLACVPSLGLFALGVLWIGFDREKRGLHDWMADTYVVVDAGARL